MNPQIMIAHKRTEVLLKKVYPTLINYPKIEHESICKEIKGNYFDLLSSLSEYMHTNEIRILNTIESKVLNLKILNELSNDRKFISQGFFKEVSRELTEISNLLK